MRVTATTRFSSSKKLIIMYSNLHFENNDIGNLCTSVIYIYGHSGEDIVGRRSHNAKLFERIEHSGSR